jgi:hypothetical protein
MKYFMIPKTKYVAANINELTAKRNMGRNPTNRKQVSVFIKESNNRNETFVEHIHPTAIEKIVTPLILT